MTLPRRARRERTKRRRPARALGIVAFATFAAACSGADEISRTVGGTTPPDSTKATTPPSDDTTPDGSAPVTTPPDEQPDNSEPTDSEHSPDEQTPTTAPTDDAAADPVVVGLAAAGFILLVGIAAWWMLRRDDPDADAGRQSRRDWPDDQMTV